ncbi:MAG: primosomal protein N' [Desulfuromonadaceae bacterium]|nr:primosomal protein N' [Desulfuromonadaceae bacterium]
MDTESFFIAEIAVLAPLPHCLSYLLPPSCLDGEVVGRRVQVPLGGRSAVGVVVAVSQKPAPDYALKSVTIFLDDGPVLTPQLLAFVRRAAAYYCHPFGLALKTALPSGLTQLKPPPVKQVTVYRTTEKSDRPRGHLQRDLLDWISDQGSVSLEQIRQQFAQPHAALKRLEEQQWLASCVATRHRDLFTGQAVVADSAPSLSEEQAAAVQAVADALTRGRFCPFLLQGVTGSGKTEVYLQSIACCLEQNRQALVLVPEIALTPQLVARFRARFEGAGRHIGVLHSGLSDGERHDVWRRINRDDIDIVIGARSAIFAPLMRLGMIVVDEEHDDSYKQGEGFRYQGRDLALLRGQMEQVPVLLGSATPSLTSFVRAREGQLQRLLLTRRVAERTLPAVELVELGGEELMPGALSPTLHAALEQTLQRGEQALLLLNRRGFSPYLLCRDCGTSFRCPNCDITLTWHRSRGLLRCHYCDYQQPPDETCSNCGGAALEPEGVGTEQLQQALQELFPAARIARMDRDTTQAKGAQQQLVERMANCEVDILVGTQMVAKGHDFSGVTLVGIIDADAALNFPDFRAAERSFALLAQVAGRAGRGERLGRVLVQTRTPDNAILHCAVSHDYQAFADQELPVRQLLDYPPYGYLVNLVLSGLNRQQVEEQAQWLAAALTPDTAVEILGPAPCPLFRLRNRYRMQILLKAPSRPPLRQLLNQLLRLAVRLPSQVRLAIDVDPVDMM